MYVIAFEDIATKYTRIAINEQYNWTFIIKIGYMFSHDAGI